MSRLLNHLKEQRFSICNGNNPLFRGLDTCPEAYNLTHPNKVERIHRSYIEAGVMSFRQIRMALTLKIKSIWLRA